MRALRAGLTRLANAREFLRRACSPADGRRSMCEEAHRERRDLLLSDPLLTHAMILCAGLGERLRPLTEELPKPLVPVGDRPVLGHITRELRRAGYHAAVANTHWMASKFNDESYTWDLALNLIHEPEIRGVAGGVAGARHLLVAPLIVWNGDTLIEDPPLAQLATVAATTGGVCLAVAPSRGPGTLGLDGAGRLVRVRAETHGHEVRSVDYSCLFSLGARALAELPDQGCLFADYCLPLLRRGEPVYTCEGGAWWDVGSLEGYLRANRDWLLRHSGRPDGSFVAPSASLGANVEVRGSVIGADAHIDGAGTIADSVIWPGARATAPLSRCVVTRLRGVQVGPPRTP